MESPVGIISSDFKLVKFKAFQRGLALILTCTVIVQTLVQQVIYQREGGRRMEGGWGKERSKTAVCMFTLWLKLMISLEEVRSKLSPFLHYFLIYGNCSLACYAIVYHL